VTGESVLSNYHNPGNKGRDRLSKGNRLCVPHDDYPIPFEQLHPDRLSFGDKLAVALSQRLQDQCPCGRVKSASHPLCPLCARYTGPNVIVVDTLGNRQHECGLVSVGEELRRYDAGGSARRALDGTDHLASPSR
jgi:hypothetical protein